MGKRKSSKKPQSRAKMAPLDKTFRCLFCQHNGSITCKLDNKTRVGRLDCKDCNQYFSVEINHLTEPIDIYSDWIDACERANNPSASRAPSHAPPASAPKIQSQSQSQPAASSRKRPASDDGADEEEEEADADDIFGGGEATSEEDLPDLSLKKKVRREEPLPEEEEEDVEEASYGRKRAVVSDDEED